MDNNKSPIESQSEHSDAQTDSTASAVEEVHADSEGSNKPAIGSKLKRALLIIPITLASIGGAYLLSNYMDQLEKERIREQIRIRSFAFEGESDVSPISGLPLTANE